MQKSLFIFMSIFSCSYSFIMFDFSCYFWGQKEKAVEEEPELDPDVAAMMGFGGFRSSKK